MLSTLSVIPNRFRFSPDIDEYSDLAVRAFTGDFPKFPKWSPSKARIHNNNSNEISKVNKNHSF